MHVKSEDTVQATQSTLQDCNKKESQRLRNTLPPGIAPACELLLSSFFRILESKYDWPPASFTGREMRGELTWPRPLSLVLKFGLLNPPTSLPHLWHPVDEMRLIRYQGEASTKCDGRAGEADAALARAPELGLYFIQFEGKQIPLHVRGSTSFGRDTKLKKNKNKRQRHRPCSDKAWSRAEY